MATKKSNPRRSNGSLRNKLRKRMKAKGSPCHLCGKPIDYELPAGHPLSFELDEIVPVSRFEEGGYVSAEQCAMDPANHAPAHRICNQRRGNKMLGDNKVSASAWMPCISKVDWVGLYGNH